MRNWIKLIKRARIIRSFDLSNIDIATIKQKVGSKSSQTKNSNGINNWIKLIKRARQVRSFDLSNLDINIIK